MIRSLEFSSQSSGNITQIKSYSSHMKTVASANIQEEKKWKLKWITPK